MTSHGSSPDATARIPSARTRPRDPDRVGDGPEAAPAEAGGEGGKPQGKGRRSGRSPGRSPARRAVKAVVILVVVLAFLFLGDRWAALYAENMVAEKLQGALKLRAEPEVHIGGFPFLARLATGHVNDVEVDVPHVPAGRVSVAQVKGAVGNVRILGFPTSFKGAELSKVRGDVFLDFDDLDREVGASQVHLVAGHGKHTVRAHGELPVAGKHAEVRAQANIRRTGDRGLDMTVKDTKLVVPGLLTYVPGKGGGLQLASPAAGKVDKHELRQTTGQRGSPDRMLRGKALDALATHPAVLKPTGVDPSLIRGLRKVQEPKVAKPMEFSARLPKDLPGDIKLRGISVTKDGIRAQLTGTKVPVGG